MSWAIAILAAGASSRFGTEKIGAELGGKPLLQHSVGTAKAAGLPTAVVVAPRHRSLVAAYAPDAITLINSRSQLGQSTSIAYAARWAIAERFDGLVLMLADMPLVSERTVRDLIKGATFEGISACAYRDGVVGIPAAFAAAMLPTLKHLTGDCGARRVIAHAEWCAVVRPAEHELFDVDTLDDLEFAQKRFAGLLKQDDQPEAGRTREIRTCEYNVSKQINERLSAPE